ncbi:threonine/homoserine/homoserine lactone efflux protein [Phyllobacterium ifriqiyense]|uniref:Threonine/homoserine/homoserine lactone efflux protein n=1 Tax=Phyllobacterium ifriqiyense TaxID=314238 RepID=A0ABU0SFQ8_9HYPH|nr:LysE family translocator [Phyllobacterium ifriqiyense]MDQ0999604.1 threonine/homoserine/homoserine lactone efflux protein [Phyllobacterium ifriqiyense]
MALDVFLTLLLFAFVTSITPGPNNLMLLTSGVNFGFRRSIPHMFGIGSGFFTLLIGVGCGLGALIEAMPVLYTVLKFAGGAYLLYLAYKIAMSRSISNVDSRARPMTFVEAAAFQWINPKAWVMAVTAMATYTSPDAYFTTMMIVGIAFAVVNIPSVSSWAAFGQIMRGWLADPVRLKWFNIIMAVLLVASLWPMLK